MNLTILHGLLIEEVGVQRAQALLARAQAMSEAEAFRVEAEALKKRIAELEAGTDKSIVDLVRGATRPTAPHLPS